MRRCPPSTRLSDTQSGLPSEFVGRSPRPPARIPGSRISRRPRAWGVCSDIVGSASWPRLHHVEMELYDGCRLSQVVGNDDPGDSLDCARNHLSLSEAWMKRPAFVVTAAPRSTGRRFRLFLSGDCYRGIVRAHRRRHPQGRGGRARSQQSLDTGVFHLLQAFRTETPDIGSHP